MRILALIVLTASLAVAAGFTAQGKSAPDARRPNIMFVLADDLAWNLVQYMPNVRAMQAQGVTFSRYFVTDSLCCPSRSTIFTGKYPHNTGVFTNGGADGGFHAFHAHGDGAGHVRDRAAAAGYRTALMGKYLNGYTQPATVDGGRTCRRAGASGTSRGNGYAEFNYSPQRERPRRPLRPPARATT